MPAAPEPSRTRKIICAAFVLCYVVVLHFEAGDMRFVERPSFLWGFVFVSVVGLRGYAEWRIACTLYMLLCSLTLWTYIETRSAAPPVPKIEVPGEPR
jgi:hypothetical protein